MSSNQPINFVATLDTSSFKAGESVITQSVASMNGQWSSIGSSVKAALSGIQDQFNEVGKTLAGSVQGMGGNFSGLLEGLASTRLGMVALVGAGAALAGSKAVNATAQMTEGAMGLARALGTSTNVAQAWRLALEDVGATEGELEGAAKGMTQRLRENEDRMQAMGLQTRDAAGNLRPMNELLQDGFELLGTYKSGTDRAMAAHELFGKGVDSSSKLLELNKDAITGATEMARELGLEVGANAVESWKEFDAASDKAGFGLKGLGNIVGTTLMPVMTDLLSVFNAAMPAAVTVVRGAIGGLSTAWHGLANGAIISAEIMMGVLYTITEPIRTVASAMASLISGSFAEAAAEMNGLGGRISGYWSAAMDNVLASSQRARSRIGAIWSSGDPEPGDPGGSDGTKTHQPPPSGKGKAGGGNAARRTSGGSGKSGGEKDESFMRYYEEALAAEKVLASERDAIHGMSKAAELAFWESIRDNAVLKEKDKLAVAKKVSDARIALMRDEQQISQQMTRISIDSTRDAEMSRVELAATAAQQRAATGEITQSELLQQEQQFEEKRYEIKRSAMEQAAALLSPDRDPVQLAQTMAQIEQLEQQHQLNLAQIRGQSAQASALETGAIWTGLGQSMSSLWDQGVTAMLNRTLTWQGTVKAVGMQLGGFFSGLAKDMVKKWFLAEQAKTGATIWGTTTRLAAESWAAIKSTAIWAASAAKNIMLSAWQAMAGAYAAIAGIPYVGPILAPITAGVVFAGVAGLVRNVASAEGGYDIPAGVNPLTQLHEKEMVLPAKHADTIRALSDGGGAGGSSGGGGDTFINHFHAMDGQSVKRVLLDNQAGLATAMAAARRNGHLSGKV